MDVGSGSSQLTSGSKRPNEDDSDYSDEEESQPSKAHSSKKPKVTSTAQEPAVTDQYKESTAPFVKSEATEVLDENEVRNLVLVFEKKALWNKEMRRKFPDQPEKFMESEIDLHEALQDLSAVTTVPDQYPLLVELKCIQILLQLLSHDNTDIYIKVVHLLQELTDLHILHESEEGADRLINALVEAEGPVLLLRNLSRLDEQVPDERDAVHDTLVIIENMTEFRPALCSNFGKQAFLLWIFKRLKVFLGCPTLWGLTSGGEARMQRMLKIIKTELEFAVQITGTPALAKTTKSIMPHSSAYRKL